MKVSILNSLENQVKEGILVQKEQNENFSKKGTIGGMQRTEEIEGAWNSKGEGTSLSLAQTKQFSGGEEHSRIKKISAKNRRFKKPNTPDPIWNLILLFVLQT